MMHGGKEFAHQHVETAVAAKRDDLARTVERLDAVGLAKGGAARVSSRSLAVFPFARLEQSRGRRG